MSWAGAIRTAMGGVLRHKVQAVVIGLVLLIATASATPAPARPPRCAPSDGGAG